MEWKRLRECIHKHPINFDQWAVSVIVSKRLTKREELSFLTVLALPKASSRGLALMIWSSRVPCKGKNSPHIWGFLHALPVLILTRQSDPPAFCQFPPSSSLQWLQLLQSTGSHASCSQSSQPRILRCQIKTKSVEVPKLVAIAVMKRKHQIYLRDQDWLILSVYKREIKDGQYCLTSYGKTWTNILANPVFVNGKYIKWHGLSIFQQSRGLGGPRPSTFSSTPVSCSLWLPPHISIQTTIETERCKEAADFLFLYSTTKYSPEVDFWVFRWI